MPNIIADSATLLKKVNAEFFNGVSSMPQSQLSSLANVTKTNNMVEVYPINLLSAGIREWIDKIEYTDGQIKELQVKNKPWQRGFKENRYNYSAMNNNLSGALAMSVQQEIADWANVDDQFIYDILVNNLTAFDGTALFADTRPNIDTGSYVLDNIETGTGTTIAQLTADLDRAITRLYGLRTKAGKPFNRGGKLAILAPTHLQRSFHTILNSQIITNSAGAAVSNINYGIAKLYVIEEQPSTDSDWYLMNEGSVFKPFIIQKQENVKYFIKDEDDDLYIRFFARALMGYSAGNPTAIVKVDN